MTKRKPKAKVPELKREPDALKRAAIKKAKTYCRSRTQPLTYEVKKIEGGDITIDVPHNDWGGYKVVHRATFGTASSEFANRMDGQVGEVMRNPGEKMPGQEQINAGIAAVAGIAPENEAETMLAVQMLGTHSLAMDMLSKAKCATTPEHLERFGTLATKMLRTYTTQIEALAKIRRGGAHKVTVEHVHVYSSGQAIVGNVTGGPGGAGGTALKMEAKPMHPPSLDRQPSLFRLIRRCCAQTRVGTPCLSPAVKGKARCRMHGGAKGSGGQIGERNGAYRTGMHTAEMIELRREVSRMVRVSNATIWAGLG